MKKFFVVFGLLAVFGLSIGICVTSTKRAYTRGCSDGYRDGYSAGLTIASEPYRSYDSGFDSGSDYDDGYDSGYEDGFCDGVNDAENINSVSRDATRYAEDRSGCHPEDALYAIDDYLSVTSSASEREVTREEFEKAAESLFWYYQYYYDWIHETKRR